MAVRVLRALGGCARIDETWLCIDDPELSRQPEIGAALDAGRARITSPRSGPSASVAAMVEDLEGPTPVLVTTADHPLLESHMLDRFLDEALASDADVIAGVVEEDLVRRAYPDAARTFLRFRDRALTGANLFVLRTPAAARAVAFWQAMDAHRKRPWRLASLLGPTMLARFAMGRLDLEPALDHLSRKVGARASVLALPFAECAMDVDRPEHLAEVERILAAREVR